MKKKPKALRTVTRMRVEHICGLMREMEFKTGITYKTLAKEWSISQDRVKQLTAMASKIVIAEVTDPERVKPDLCKVLMRCVHEAAAAKKYNDVASCARVYAEILGVKNAPQTVVNVNAGDITPADARAILARELGTGAMPKPETDDTAIAGPPHERH